jgi:DNA repair protein RadC
LGNSQGAYELFRSVMEDLDRESFWVACLSAKNAVNCLSQVSLGSLEAAAVHPREVFKVAILANASGIIVAHNHPSGDPEPSHEDRKMTFSLQQAAGMLGITLLDHLVVGDGRFYSFADEHGW